MISAERTKTNWKISSRALHISIIWIFALVVFSICIKVNKIYADESYKSMFDKKYDPTNFKKKLDAEKEKTKIEANKEKTLLNSIEIRPGGSVIFLDNALISNAFEVLRGNANIDLTRWGASLGFDFILHSKSGFGSVFQAVLSSMGAYGCDKPFVLLSAGLKIVFYEGERLSNWGIYGMATLGAIGNYAGVGNLSYDGTLLTNSGTLDYSLGGAARLGIRYPLIKKKFYIGLEPLSIVWVNSFRPKQEQSPNCSILGSQESPCNRVLYWLPSGYIGIQW